MGEPFIDFTFGSFNSSNYGIIRTSDSDRYTISLAPPVQDKTMDITGMNGSYYFGATYKPKTFDVNFAFYELNNTQLSALKTAFTTTDLQTLHFEEDTGSYIAKVTGEPTIKVIPFDNGSGGTIYRGEGSV
jgi:phage-related protein